jgi:Zn-dependent protease/CBS domain-containing protein
VHSITLFLLGGVSDIEREPRSAGAEFFTAIAGPITSLVLGFVFLLVGSGLAAHAYPTGANFYPTAESALDMMSGLGPFPTLLAWLGPVNIAIGLFNMIPAFPLDGGRVLRALLWAISGNMRSATRWAARTGQVIAWLFIAAGIAQTFGIYVPYFGTGFASGLWLAFIGWFLYSAASQATTRLALDDAMAGMTVSRLMRTDLPVVPPDLSVATLVQEYLVRGGDRALAVVDNGQLEGVVCFSDVRKIPPEQWATTRVASVMRSARDLFVATPEQPLSEAFEQLIRRDIDQLPVVTAGRLVGMLRRRDVARWLELAWRPEQADARSTGAPSRTRPPSFPHNEPHPRSV